MISDNHIEKYVMSFASPGLSLVPNTTEAFFESWRIDTETDFAYDGSRLCLGVSFEKCTPTAVKLTVG